MRIALIASLAFLAGCSTQTLDAPPPKSASLLTAAESSGFTRTTTHAECVTLLNTIAASSPLARRVSMGTSKEGRDIPVILFADPPVATAQEARAAAAKGRPTVLLFANIHAGEVDPKEGLLMLARELAEGRHPELTRDLVVAIAPIFNADGNERLGPADTHRPGQNGPDPVGKRENSDGLDLNRDFCKLEAPETRALVRFLNDFDPLVVLDGHTTNGSHHRYLITTAGPKSPAGDPRLVEFARSTFFPDLMAGFENSTGQHAFWYGNFEGEFGDRTRGWSRWESFPAHARFGTTYIGLRGRVSVLLESYSYAPFRDRVLGSRAFALETLRTAARLRAKLLDHARAADAEAIDGKPIAITSREAEPVRAVVKGFDETTAEPGKSGLLGDPRDYTVDLVDRFEAEQTVTGRPAYAIIDPPASVVETLAAHGIRAERLAAPRRVSAERLRVKSAAQATRAFQGHKLTTLAVDTEPAEVELPVGTLFIPTRQPLGRLAVYLLEPAGEDSLATWNHFDAWAKPGALLPIVRVR